MLHFYPPARLNGHHITAARHVHHTAAAWLTKERYFKSFTKYSVPESTLPASLYRRRVSGVQTG